MDFKPFKIGKFLLLERIATGGMAEVYRAKASGAGGFEKQLALKRIIPSYSQNEEFRRMFEYEARLSSMLTHANIVQVYDFVKSGDTYLLAMEYVDGKNLRQVINKTIKASVVLPIEASVFIINEVCKGLGYAHDKKDEMRGRALHIIHRDMSPQNIMLSYEGNVKIVDFGIAKAKDRVDETRSGVIKGKFGYMSPEQASGEEIDHRTDIFSTGIILYEMLTQKRLFAADNDMATLKRIQECIIQRPTLVNPKIPIELEKILLKALAKDQKLRYQTAQDFHKKLQEFVNKFYPAYTQVEISEMLTKLFDKEIRAEKRRIEQAYQQSIPFSQGSGTERDQQERGTGFDQIDEALDGPVTQSEHDAVTMVTDASELPQQEPTPPPVENTTTKKGDPELEDPLTEASQPHWDAPPEPPAPSFSSTNASKKESQEIEMEDKSSLGEDALSSIEQAKTDETMAAEPEENTATPTLADRSIEKEKNPSLGKKLDAEFTNPVDQIPDPEFTEPEGKKEEIANKTPNSQETPTSTHSASDNRIIDQEASVADTSISFVTEHDLLLPPSPSSNQTGSIPSDTSTEEQTFSQVSRFPKPASREETSVVRTLLTLVLAIFVLLGSAYLYLAFTKTPDPQNFVQDIPTPATKPERPVTSLPPRGLDDGNCIVRIDSDPRKAQIFVNGKDRGLTPNGISVRCRERATIELRLDGYQPVLKALAFKNRNIRVYETLSPILTGTIQLTLSHNATVFVESRQIAEAKALQPLKLKLRSGRSYKVYFENKALGIEAYKEYFIRNGTIIKSRINLDKKK